MSQKRYRYTGKEKDEESGLYYHGARYLAPWLARWTSADPLDFVDGPNRYAYVAARPIIQSDPSGRAGTPPLAEEPASTPVKNSEILLAVAEGFVTQPRDALSAIGALASDLYNHPGDTLESMRMSAQGAIFDPGGTLASVMVGGTLFGATGRFGQAISLREEDPDAALEAARQSGSNLAGALEAGATGAGGKALTGAEVSIPALTFAPGETAAVAVAWEEVSLATAGNVAAAAGPPLVMMANGEDDGTGNKKPSATGGRSKYTAPTYSEEAAAIAEHADKGRWADFGARSFEEFAEAIDYVMASADETRQLARGREAFWRWVDEADELGEVVIYNPDPTTEGGTAFVTDYDSFLRLK